MSKLINEPIVAHESKLDIVAAFIWRKRVYRVLEIISRWHEQVNGGIMNPYNIIFV